MGQWNRIKDDVMFGRVRQVAAPVGGRVSGNQFVSHLCTTVIIKDNKTRYSTVTGYQKSSCKLVA